MTLEARGLTWTPLGRPDPVLAGLDLRIEAGERVLLAGASGAGKSTLLRALAGVLGEVEPGDLSGEITLDGAPVRAGEGRIGLLLQEPRASIVAGRVGRDVAFGPENLGVPRAEIHDRVARALADVGFPYGPEHRTAALSGGEAQRLALAGVLAMHPQMLLLDEPTAMLDDDAASDVRAAVSRVVADRRVGLVVVEHRLDRWLGRDGGVDLVDRLVVIGVDGIVADGAPAAVLAARGDALTDAGLWVPGAPAPTPTRLDIPAPVRDVHGEALRLEQVGLVRRPLPGLSIARHPDPVPALIDVDLSVPAAAMTALRGRSGAGKSSLLGVAAGLDEPTNGRVVASSALADGLTGGPGRWRSADLAARIAWVPQQASLAVVGTTVLDTLLATARTVGLPGAVAEAAARSLLEQLHLDGLDSRNPYSLSGGQLRRLALASALVHGPSILALDEPSVGQDRHTWAAVAGVCRAAVAGGAAVLLSTHDDELSARADVVHHISAGRLQEDS